MKEKKSLIFSVLLLILIFSVLGFVGAADLTVCSSGCDYTSIQDAIDAASEDDTINVEAGTYGENPVIDKEITLLGANHDVDPDGSTDRGGESIITGLVQITEDGATINGFKISEGRIFIDGADSAVVKYNIIADSSSFGIGIDIDSPNAQILYNTISSPTEEGIWVYSSSGAKISYNDLSDVTDDYEAIPIFNHGGTDIEITYNTITSGKKGINYWGGGGDVIISYNEISGTLYEAIQTDKKATIQGNVIEGGWGIHLGYYDTGSAESIVIENQISNSEVQGILVSDKHDKVTISDNTISNAEYDGIALYQTSVASADDKSVVSGNTISRTKYSGIAIFGRAYTEISDNLLTECNYYGADGTGDWDYAGIHVQDCDWAGCDGETSDYSTITGNTVSDGINGIQTWSDYVTITSNEVYDMGNTYEDEKIVEDRTYKNSGILVGSNFGSDDYDPIGITINNNKIYNNYWGLFHNDGLTNEVDAENNWWGDLDPSDDVSNNVDYSPWLGAVPETSPMTWYTNDNIQDAIDAASESDTVYVATGTFEENLIIDKGLTLLGEDNENTIIEGDGGIVITINSDNVKINGFTIRNPVGSSHSIGIYSQDKNNLEITNNIILSIGDGSPNTKASGIAIVSSSSSVDNIEISNNKISDVTGGDRISSPPSSTSSEGIAIGWSGGSNDITNLIIQNNSIYDISTSTKTWENGGRGAYGIFINHKTVAPQILDNTIYNLEGLWAHGIGLEGDTPNAVVEGNEISDLTDHKDPSDAVDLFFEANPSADSVTINNNIFLATIGWGLAMHPTLISTYPDLIITAINNWWGTNDGEEIEDMIFGNIVYAPWIGQSEDEVETVADEPEEVDTTGTDTSITLTTSSAQSGTISVQQTSSDSHGGFSASALGKFISIESEIPDEKISNVEIGIDYTDAEVLASSIDETTLKVYWWDGDSWEFEGTTEGCHDSVGCYGVDTVNNYVWIVTDHFSDYGAGGENDTEGPSITDINFEPEYPNLDSTLITVYATITDPSGVADYPELRWKIINDGITYPETGYYSAPQMDPVGDDIYRTTFEVADPEDNMEIVYKIVAEDNLGNVGETDTEFQELFTYDGSDPITSDDASTNWTNDDVIVELECTDPISGCAETYYSTDGSDPETLYDDTPFTLTETGQYQLKYYSIDNARNPEDIVEGTLVRIDKEIPTITDGYTNDGIWVKEDQTITLSPEDTGGSDVNEIKYCEGESCDPSTEGTVLDTPYELVYSTSQNTTVRYQVWDNADNPSAIGEFNVKIDKTTPITNDDVPADWQTSSDLPFDVELTEPTPDGLSPVVTYYKIWKDGEDEPEYSVYSLPIPVDADGEYNIKYYSEDEAGNVETENTATNTAKLDTTNPSLTLESDAETYADDFTLEITESDETSGLNMSACEYRIDGGVWNPRTCQTDLTIHVGEGEECEEDSCEIEVRAVDIAGNPVTESKTFTIDYSNPPSILSSGPSETVITNWAVLEVETNKPATCKYDTEYKSDYDAMTYTMNNTGSLEHTQTITELADDSYDYYVICKDTVNNKMSYPATISFDVDTREGFAVTIPQYSGEYLRAGWNNFYLPSFVLENTSLEYNEELEGYEVDDVLESIEGSWEVIYHFDGTGWIYSYRPERPVNDLTHFNGGEFPYFIYMNVSGERIEIEY